MADILTFEPTNSSHVRHLAYDPDVRDLEITFANGSTYHHSNVPPHIFAAMTRHPSVGQYYHRVIRVHYPIRKPSHGNHKEQNEAR